MEQSLLMTHPHVPCTVPSDGMHDPVRYGRYASKPASLQERDSALRPHPNLPAMILKDGLRDFVRQPAVGDLPHHARPVRAPLGEAGGLGGTANATLAAVAINHGDLPLI